MNAGEAYQAWCREWAAGCLWALRPGAHLAAFGSPRTAHRLGCGLEEATRSLEVRRPDGARPDEIEAMLAAVPDLRPSLQTAGPEELADLLEAFDVTAVYDKGGRTLELGATVIAELVPDKGKPRRSGAPSGISSIAGAGFEPATFGL